MTLRTSFTVILAGLLASCGGGGSSPASGAPTPSTPTPTPATPGLSLIMGSIGSDGNLDGKGDAARFSDIISASADGAGNLLVLDTVMDRAAPVVDSTRIRRISASGEVSTVLVVRDSILGIAQDLSASTDSRSVLLLARNPDGDKVVYKIQPDGSSAQWLSAAQTGGTATERVVAGLNGGAYLLRGRQISVVNASGSAVAVVGDIDDTSSACRDGSGSAVRLGYVRDAVADAAGNLIVLACGSVRKITPAGVTTTLAGDLKEDGVAKDGSASAAHFGDWRGSLSIDARGELRVLDYQYDALYTSAASTLSYRLRKVGSDGAVTTLLNGTLPYNNLLQADFDRHVYPGALGPYKLVRYLADGTLALTTPAQVVTLQGTTRSTLAGNEGDIRAEVLGPVAGTRILQPEWLTARPDGLLYVLNHEGNIYSVERGGQVSKLIQGLRAPTARPPVQIMHRAGKLYLVRQTSQTWLDKAPSGGANIEIIDLAQPTQAPVALAGNPNTVLQLSWPREDGAGANATFWKADLLGFDAAGNLYVGDASRTDSQLALYRKITPQGVVSTISALPSDLGAERESTTGSQDGSRYTYDVTQGVVYRVAASGTRTAVAGVAGQNGVRLGVLPGSLRTDWVWQYEVNQGVIGRRTPQPVVALAPNTYALLAGGAILQLVVPAN
jgi:hypothetical protein